uniref:Reverse transcriptase domain-containing protein n=1 Tax=Tanacetum cinerariifolium TaxID=118510 RepID=A0A699H4L7_TANCI|nr:hypothetical protein [Tanacetum cinerariifolium]
MQQVAPPSSVYVPETEYPEYLVPLEDEARMEDQPLPADASPVALSPGYVADSNPKEDPKEDLEEDHADYPDDEPFDDDDDNDDTDDEDEEDQDDDKEEEEHLAPTDSSAVPIVDVVLSPGDTEAFETDEACFTTPAPELKIEESSAAGAARQPGPTLKADLRRDRFEGMVYGITDTWDKIVEAMLEVAPTTLKGVDQRVIELDTTIRQKAEEFKGMASSEDRSAAIEAHVRTLEVKVATLITQTSSLQTQLTTTLGRIETLEARDPEPHDEQAEASNSYRSRDGDNSHGSGTGGRRQVPTQRECTYTDFLKLQALIDRGVAVALVEHDADRSRDGDNSHGSGTDERRQVPTQ